MPISNCVIEKNFEVASKRKIYFLFHLSKSSITELSFFEKMKWSGESGEIKLSVKLTGDSFLECPKFINRRINLNKILVKAA